MVNGIKGVLKLAREWADKINDIKGIPQHILAKELSWGFRQVESGRHPDIVLKDVLERIEWHRKPVIEHETK